jgi:hypothetical protein
MPKDTKLVGQKATASNNYSSLFFLSWILVITTFCY